ncbi:MAG: prepilin-type N-terminal cleavage/methylation domain-containing protein [Candidatus Tritonobacter lacicola]|nr:prepilin-type N-terminal cleavage/methylation domain-containing protein [Candidatus Tritonobacter lacicola]
MRYGVRTMKAAGRPGRRGGFTLVEVLVASSLAAVAAGVIFSGFISMQKNFIAGNSYIDIHRDARMAMDWLAKDIRWAIELEPSHGAYATSNNCIVLRVPSVDSAGNVIDVENDHDFIIFKLKAGSPTELERIVDAKDGVSGRIDEIRTVADNIDSLEFSYNGTELYSVGNFNAVTHLDIVLTTSTTVTGVELTDTLSTTTKLRNKE